jgi:hypothetical protein
MATLQTTTFTELALPQGTTGQRPGSPSLGMVRYNTDYVMMEYWDGTNWRPVSGYSHGTVGTGGDSISMLGGGMVHQFTSTGSFTFTPSFTGYVQVLIVGGGGGSHNGWSGGGGGGGMIFNRSYPVSAGVGIGVTVGGGGAHANNGGSSVFGGTTANGGGHGGYWDTSTPGNPGASGGGGANTSIDGSRFRVSGGIGITGQGFPGGSGVRFNDDGENTHNGGGGGGAGGPGLASQDSNQRQATHGGPGAAHDILGDIFYWSGGGASGPHICDGGGGDGGVGGGGGGGSHYSPGYPRTGYGHGGGQAINNTRGGDASAGDGHARYGGSGATNSGGGGGNAGSGHGSGGSGIVIVRY